MNITDLDDFQVSSGQLDLHSFGVEGVRCLSLMIMTLMHYPFNGKHIKFNFDTLCRCFSLEAQTD